MTTMTTFLSSNEKFKKRERISTQMWIRGGTIKQINIFILVGSEIKSS